MIWNILSWIFGCICFAIGLVNIFWGNDPGFGIFIVLLSFIYFPVVYNFIRTITGFSIHFVVKILIGIFIVWASLGVGELSEKIEIMIRS